MSEKIASGITMHGFQELASIFVLVHPSAHAPRFSNATADRHEELLIGHVILKHVEIRSLEQQLKVVEQQRRLRCAVLRVRNMFPFTRLETSSLALKQRDLKASTFERTTTSHT